jgi:hypothetical protein
MFSGLDKGGHLTGRGSMLAEGFNFVSGPLARCCWPVTARPATTDSQFEEIRVQSRHQIKPVGDFLIFRTIKEPDLQDVLDIGDFLNDRIAAVADLSNSERDKEEEAFRETFEILALELGDDAFHRYDVEKGRFMGGFSISAFEGVALGLGFQYGKSELSKISNITDRIKQLWSDETFARYSGSGVRASTRIPKIVPLGRKLFKP